MGITYPANYPASVDTFPVPALPEITSLSSPGTANRAHTDHHRDLGLGLTAVMQHAALKIHAHAGSVDDPTPKLTQSVTHEQADTDLASSSLHHTLGKGALQAATGNHTHDYYSGEILNAPYLICPSSARPVAPWLGLQIYEYDTNRVRVWSQFANNTTVGGGLDYTDTFERTSTVNLGSDYQITYIGGDGSPASGTLATKNGHEAAWIDHSNDRVQAIAQMVNPAYRHTQSTNQAFTWTTGNTLIEEVLWFTYPSYNDAYLRMSDDGQQYLRMTYGIRSITVFYTLTGPSGEKEIGRLSCKNAITQMPMQVILNDYSFDFYQMGSYVGTIKDINHVSANDPAINLGWGLGMMTGYRIGGQTTPASVASVRIQDVAVLQTIPRWNLLPVASIPYCRLRQTAAQRINPTGSIVEWGVNNSSTIVEDNFGYYDPSTSLTNVVIREPGLYHLDAAVQWNPEKVSDNATVVFCVNGIETMVRTQQWMRGNGWVPNFSQTVAVSGKLRFAANDILTLKVKYNAGGGFSDWFSSFFDSNSRIASRLDLSFIGV